MKAKFLSALLFTLMTISAQAASITPKRLAPEASLDEWTWFGDLLRKIFEFLAS